MNMKNSEMKSKVVTLANRLAPLMDGNRTGAFLRAWAIVKAGGLEIAVKGTSFQNRQSALKRLAAYAPEQIRAVLVPEPTNPQDGNAIAVMCGVQGGKGLFHLGYVPANLTQVVTAIGRQLPVLRVVSGTWGARTRRRIGGKETVCNFLNIWVCRYNVSACTGTL
jgi:hypothetical protein